MAHADPTDGCRCALGYVVGYLLYPMAEDIGWRWMVGLGAIPPMVLLLGLTKMPESPRFLVDHGDPVKAEQVLRQFCEPEETDAMLTYLQSECTLKKRGTWSDVFCAPPEWRRLLWAGMGTAVFQQITGVQAAVYYTPDVLRKAGVDSIDDQFLANIGVGAIKLLFVCFALLVVDKRVGRKKMLLASAVRQ